MAITRRQLLARTGAAGLGLALAGASDVLLTAGPALGAGTDGYGPLLPDPDGLLDLPRGFRYRVLSQTGTPMSARGGFVPNHFDGMASFVGPREATLLVRNHELTAPIDFPVVAPPSHTYDPAVTGGTTTLQVSAANRTVAEYVSLGGTATNCAGGRSPWNTWLTCEENEEVLDGVPHGFVFEVDPYDNALNADPTPLRAMGRFKHEAVAVDPRTGVVYETEDARDPFGLLYRFTPNRPSGGHGSLRAGGTLDAMRIPGLPDLSVVTEIGASFPVQWVRVPDPVAATTPTRMQLTDITRSQKLEGTWWGHDAAYVVASFAKASDGAPAEHAGQVWRLDPDAGTITLVLRFATGGTYDAPDNITVSPWGGVMIAEDGDGEIYLVGATEGGEPYAFARNARNVGTPAEPVYSELAGATFSADGRTLFVNVYAPGMTFAVTGPWRRRGAG